jgi:AcrR family transcriptional regulator
MRSEGREALQRNSMFGEMTPLPRGPHRLSREEVQASQRTRLLTAIVDLVAERGYADTTITAIARKAGVSPNVFYEHFADREACFVAAYDAFTTTLFERMGRMVPSAVNWDDFIKGMLESYFGLLEEEPRAARAFLVEIEGAGTRARARRRAAYLTATAFLHEQHDALRQQDPSLGALPQRAFLGFVHACRDLACDVLEYEPETDLRALIPDLAAWITASVYGAAAIDAATRPSRTATTTTGAASSPVDGAGL